MLTTSVPKGWEIMSIGDFTLEHKQGYYTKQQYENEGVLLARITDLGNPKVNFCSMPKLQVSEKDYQAFKVSKGDFLFARSGAIGRYGIISHEPPKTIFASYLIRFRFSEQVNSYYVGQVYESELTQAQIKAISQGNANININAENIKKLKILVPPIREQQKIAEVLSTVDKKIDLIDQKIAETEKLKTGLMQKLFSEGIGVQDENGDWQPHAEFEDNGLPMHWGFLKLGSVAKVTSGGTPSRKKASFWENGTIPWITTGEVNFNCITNSSQKITDEGLKNSAAKMFPPDTILMAMYGQGQTRGRVAMLGIEASTNQACAAIICSKKLNPHFCYHYLSSQYEKIRAIGNEGSQKNLNGQIIKDILIPCPNLEEQEQIALVLSTVDEKITLLAKQKSETQQLKKGLMQKLLTGEWRVPVEETEAA
ncbi:TPA: restriction endonuclease subunit S [Vibrio parahaemolyticus]|uniref:restriction endonuclease subunit S n=1 Tax=Vibrio fluvialis TaxID=676 RepID=UPI000C21BCD4|nr:restriction endonuclease subunit S [Vibrio fluvialis]EGZ6802159.1 restriction endonuclease subunit S [Vibrio cholerae]HCG6790152.1 restriction endonuclease subunit S [Vibrio parahaemolyticus]EJH4015934.1 restriction endonuclease subunit S [Vibrio cholerae]EKF9091133.1 restriction endonuclease subunit S [Vibrio cholerae]EKF9470145.1 restriction endonuclease subunit S [Vibrio cholerae]